MMKLNNYKSERLTVGLFFRILRESGLWNGEICTDLFSHGVIQILRKDITPGLECIENTYFMRQTTAARSVAFQVKIQPEFSHESYHDLRRDLQQGYEALGIEGIMTQFLNRKVEVRAMPFSDKLNKEGGACIAKFAFPYWDLETPEMLSAAGRLGYFLYVDFTNSSGYNVLTDNVLISKLEAFTAKTAFCEEMMHDPKIEQYREKYKEMEDKMAEKFGDDCLVRHFRGQPLPGMFPTLADRDSAIHGIIRGDVLDIEEQAFRSMEYRHRLSDPGEMNELINDFRDMTWNAVDILNKKYCIKWASLSNSYTV